MAQQHNIHVHVDRRRICTKKLIHENYGFQHATLNFSESGHGNDVGATIYTGRQMSYLRDISNCDDLYKDVVSDEINVFMYHIKLNAIHEMDLILSANINTVPDTMTLHLFMWNANERRIIITKCRSCLCLAKCPCFNPSEHILHEII